MSDFEAVITQAGLNAAVSASNLGVSLKITEVGAGTSGFTPARSTTALVNEVMRIPIAGGSNVSGNQVHLTAVFDTGAFTCRAVGFYLENGVLFAVWSHPSNILFVKTALNKVAQAFDLLLDAVPIGSITVDITGSLSLYYAEDFAKMATAQIDNMRRFLTDKLLLLDAEII